MYGIVTDQNVLTKGLSTTDEPEWYILSGSAAFTRTMVPGNIIRGPFTSK
jgi:hypothetical protein